MYCQNYEDELTPNPKVGAYFSVVTHLKDYDLHKRNVELLPLHSVGFPVGVNFWIAKNFAFSIEFVPSVRLNEHVDQVNNSITTTGLLFHPGFTYTFSDHYGFSARIAFESNGQVGFTPVIGRTFYHLKNSNFSVSIPFPFRFGGNLPTTLSVGLQLGWGF
ncbi:hypothetical protein JCM31826_22240 [Thermaurantimonas aggregans]|uniref:Outer membrane protein beta-barrel domain-containing protein n=1 Tax=Thermaurantimonas aggregans TaxID=2173829 RepID=A0A401XP22_9FLAO|nr:hypothetical protein [Thermaurantimonas aggregans]MCX8148041.1 hypothetical protein [Thermaurantimonas aggregans]GCD78742.1 hypothetical protein JCM31826_22240 [Thermaurantimonas aggregans]